VLFDRVVANWPPPPVTKATLSAKLLLLMPPAF
jgi:hypothetical protein